MRSGLATMLTALRRDPHALESVYLSVITFDASARVAVPLTSLLDFQEPELRVRPGTALGAALELLADRMREEVRTTVAGGRGDYRPLVLLLTDGQPSDDWRTPLVRVGVQARPRPANIYAIGCGLDVDYAVLQGITDVVLRMDDMSHESFARLFVWLTASVASASQGVIEATDGRIRLEKLPDHVQPVVEKAASLPEGPARQLFLRARCSVKRFPYLMRYRFDPERGFYLQVKAHRLTDEEGSATEWGRLPEVPARMIRGVLACPWCEKPEAGHCNHCGTIFCVDFRDSTSFPCPGCGAQLTMQEGSDFNVRQSGG